MPLQVILFAFCGSKIDERIVLEALLRFGGKFPLVLLPGSAFFLSHFSQPRFFPAVNSSKNSSSAGEVAAKQGTGGKATLLIKFIYQLAIQLNTFYLDWWANKEQAIKEMQVTFKMHSKY